MSGTIRIIPPLFVLLWATGFIGARYAMPWAEPFSFLAVRFAIAAAIFVVLGLALGRGRISFTQATHSMIAGALLHGVYLGGVFWAIRNGMPAGLTALIIGLQPLITAVLAGRVLGEKVEPRHWTGLALGFMGIAVVLAPKLGEVTAGITPATLIVCFIGAIGISVGTIWQKKHVGQADLVAGTLWQYVGGAALAAIAALLLESGTYTMNGELAFAMAWLVLVLSIGAVFLLMVMIRQGEMSKVSSLFYLVPIVTAIMAWILFGESLTVVQMIGMAITTVGVGMATRR